MVRVANVPAAEFKSGSKERSARSTMMRRRPRCGDRGRADYADSRRPRQQALPDRGQPALLHGNARRPISRTISPRFLLSLCSMRAARGAGSEAAAVVVASFNRQPAGIPSLTCWTPVAHRLAALQCQRLYAVHRPWPRPRPQPLPIWPFLWARPSPSIVRICCRAQIPFDRRTVVASLLDWANGALKNKISRERSMPRLDEKRDTQRQQTLTAGTISFDGSGIDCLVRKMSGYGANLEVESQIGIPNSFDLVIDTEHSNHHCHVVWRKARRIGIAFD
jgi:hypothetical protein